MRKQWTKTIRLKKSIMQRTAENNIKWIQEKQDCISHNSKDDHWVRCSDLSVPVFMPVLLNPMLNEQSKLKFYKSARMGYIISPACPWDFSIVRRSPQGGIQPAPPFCLTENSTSWNRVLRTIKAIYSWIRCSSVWQQQTSIEKTETRAHWLICSF